MIKLVKIFCYADISQYRQSKLAAGKFPIGNIAKAAIDKLSIKIKHPPGSWTAERCPIVNFPRVNRDDITRVRLDIPAPTQGFLPTTVHQTNAELVVSMPPKRDIAVGVYRLDTRYRNWEKLNGMLTHDVRFFPVAVGRVARAHNR